MTTELASARILHASLAVSDIDRSLAFYEPAFGAQVTFRARHMTDLIRRTTGVPQLCCDLAQLRFGDDDHGCVLELIAFRDIPTGCEDAAPVRVGHGHICLGMPNFDGALALAVEWGASMIGEVVIYPEGRSVYLREPGGSVLELEEVAS